MTALQVCGGFCLVLFSCIYGLRMCLCTTVTWFTGGTMVFVVLTPLLARFYSWENRAWCWSRFKEPPSSIPLFSTMRSRASGNCLFPYMFGCCPSVGRIPRMIRVADKILPPFRARCRQRTLSASQPAQPLFGTRCRSSAARFGTFDRSSPSDRNERLMHLFLCPNPCFPA